MSDVIHVQARYFNVVRDAAQRSEESLAVEAGTTLRQLVAGALAREHPALVGILLTAGGDISPFTRFFLNGTLLRQAELDGVLHEGDEIRIFPAIAGG
jgi:molybdopterin converting factor small subunit